MAEFPDAASITGDEDEEVEEDVAKGLLLEISREIIAAPISLQNACLTVYQTPSQLAPMHVTGRATSAQAMAALLPCMWRRAKYTVVGLQKAVHYNGEYSPIQPLTTNYCVLLVCAHMHVCMQQDLRCMYA